jgi:beta-ribofuranosylaminobenzene 5'-phosphate synthase
MTRIIGYPRIHLGLLDLGAATPRLYGGAGAALDGPETTVTVEDASRSLVTVESPDDSSGIIEAISAALARLGAYARREIRLDVRLVTAAPSHIGLGTKTTSVLAALVAASAHLELAVTEGEIQLLSRRAGTSGVGIHTFFSGGYVLDGGHRAPIERRYTPSSIGAPSRIPPALVKIRMPDQWVVSLILPAGRRFFGQQEADFFNANTPLKLRDVERSIAIALMGMTSAVAEADLPAFAEAVAVQQSVGFKAREITAQSDDVADALRSLGAIEGVAVGMSSMGPLVFVVRHCDDEQAKSAIESLTVNGQHGRSLGEFRFQNCGFRRC